MSGENEGSNMADQLKWALGRIKELEEELSLARRYIEDSAFSLQSFRAAEEYRSEQVKGRDDV